LDDVCRDQELRFTVHDSPDYYNLKISVFNDDKRTELIGETFVNLDKIIVAGGGQNDQWVELSCRGKYAGQLRVELTYYDTRPKEERPVTEKRRENARVGEDGEPVALGGPRTMKPVTRRPLPADPVNGSPAPTPFAESPMQTPPRAFKQSQNNQPSPHTPHGPEYRATPPSAHQRVAVPSHKDSYGFSNALPHQAMPLEHQGSQMNLYDPNQNLGDDPYAIEPAQPEYNNQAAAPYDPFQQSNVDNPSLGRGNSGSGSNLSMNNAYSHSPALSTMHSSGYSIPHPSVEPHQYNGQFQPYVEDEIQQQSYALEAPQSYEPDMHASPEPLDGPPPPPPAHRVIQNTHVASYGSADSMFNNGPSPLALSNGRGSSSPGMPRDEHYGSNSPQGSYGYQSTTSVPRHSRPGSIGEEAPRPQQSVHDLPLSLQPGYNPNSPPVIDPTTPERSAQYTPWRRSTTEESVTAPISYQSTPPTQSYSHSTSPRPHPLSKQVSPDSVVTTDHRRPHRQSIPSAPLSHVGTPNSMNTHPATPTSRPNSVHTVPRKSLSPQPPPSASTTAHRLSGIPFGPDDYDTFNPNLASSASVNDLGAKYRDPREAEEVHHQRQREALRGGADVPIRDASGNVVDPSDHLPSDTWAPEPVRKESKSAISTTQNRRGPRELPSPQGPMSSSGRDNRTFAQRSSPASQRPHSIVTPIYSTPSGSVSGGPEVSPTKSEGRNRLQKRGDRGGTVRPHSSSAPMTPDQNYPLREHDGYGYNSPAYNSPQGGYGSAGGYSSRNSPAGRVTGPPPIPAKIPMTGSPMGAKDPNWALSEEMSRIDIGSSVGRRRRH
jgi:hypothetical protein